MVDVPENFDKYEELGLCADLIESLKRNQDRLLDYRNKVKDNKKECAKVDNLLTDCNKLISDSENLMEQIEEIDA